MYPLGHKYCNPIIIPILLYNILQRTTYKDCDTINAVSCSGTVWTSDTDVSHGDTVFSRYITKLYLAPIVVMLYPTTLLFLPLILLIQESSVSWIIRAIPLKL